MQSFGLVRSPVPSREWHSLHAVHVRFVAAGMWLTDFKNGEIMTFDELKDGSFFCRVIGGIGASIGVCALTKIDSSRFCESSRSDTGGFLSGQDLPAFIEPQEVASIDGKRLRAMLVALKFLSVADGSETIGVLSAIQRTCPQSLDAEIDALVREHMGA